MRPSSVNAVCHSLSRQITSRPVTRCCHRKFSALAQKVDSTPRTLPEPISIPHEPPIHQQRTDPYVLMTSELTQIRKNLLDLLGTAHPGLTGIAECYFLHPSKQLRSLLVLLFSRATNGLGGQWDQKEWNAAWETTSSQSEILDRPLTTSSTLYEWNPSMPDHTASFESVFPLQEGVPRPEPPPMPPRHASLSQSIPPGILSSSSILPTQMRLAQIVEMVHVASLLHDTISSGSEPKTDSSETTEPNGFGNKLAILGGDFLLGRASASLSRLGESKVVELIASVISNLVEGEIMRMQEVKTPTLGLVPGPSSLPAAWDLYMKKTYLKTASLFAKGARSAVILGGSQHGDIWRDVAYAYGRNLGIAYQLLDDTIEFKHMQPGLATAPALLASEECPQLLPLIQRNFAQPGDTQLAVEYVQGTTGIERTRLLAEAYASKARDTLQHLPEGENKQALESLTEIVINRTW